MRRERVAVAAALVVALLACELGARALAANLPQPLRWHSWEAQIKVDTMSMLRRRGGADIVAVGNSMMDVAFDPLTFVKALGTSCVAYNASLGALSPRVLELWTHRTVMPRLRPSVVLVGAQTLDLNENEANRERFRRRIAGSVGARRDWRQRSQLDRLDEALARRSVLYRLRETLREPVTVLKAASRPQRAAIGEARFVGPHGEMRVRRDDLYEPDARYDPRGRYTSRNVARSVRAAAIVRAVLRDFGTGGTDRRALSSLLEQIRATGARAMLVVMPVHPRYIELHPGGQAEYEHAKRELADIASETGARLVDMDTLKEDRLYADVNHLNGEGMRRFSEALGSAVADAAVLDRASDPAGARCTMPTRASR